MPRYTSWPSLATRRPGDASIVAMVLPIHTVGKPADSPTLSGLGHDAFCQILSFGMPRFGSEPSTGNEASLFIGSRRRIGKVRESSSPKRCGAICPQPLFCPRAISGTWEIFSPPQSRNRTSCWSSNLRSERPRNLSLAARSAVRVNLNCISRCFSTSLPGTIRHTPTTSLRCQRSVRCVEATFWRRRSSSSNLSTIRRQPLNTSFLRFKSSPQLEAAE
jgi:hypothetical protein